MMTPTIPADYYDQIATGYSELHGTEQAAKADIIRKLINPAKTDTVLDIGCGPCAHDFGRRVIGIDTSMGLLKQSLNPVVQGRAENLPFRDNSIDTAVSITALHNFDSPEKALQEAARVCRGRLAITVLKKSRKAGRLGRSLSQLFNIEAIVEERFDTIYMLTTKYK